MPCCRTWKQPKERLADLAIRHSPCARHLRFQHTNISKMSQKIIRTCRDKWEHKMRHLIFRICESVLWINKRTIRSILTWRTCHLAAQYLQMRAEKSQGRTEQVSMLNQLRSNWMTRRILPITWAYKISNHCRNNMTHLEANQTRKGSRIFKIFTNVCKISRSTNNLEGVNQRMIPEIPLKRC